MLRIFIKKLKLKKTKKKIIKLYNNILFINASSAFYQYKVYDSFFFLTLPKRQQFFTIFNLKENKQFNLSSGRFLAFFGKRAKFFKRNPKNIAGIVMQLKKSYIHLLKYIYLFYIKNCNKRQYSFFEKFIALIKPHIFFLVHKQSYIPRFLPTRRIKRKVLKIINKQ